MKIPVDIIDPVARAIDAAHEAVKEAPRQHLGASIIGHECDRWLWYSFRWAVIEQFPGRIKRLFRRGHREEETLIADLKFVGVDFRPAVSIDFGAHVGGTPDGIAVSGVPDAERSPHVLEFKTHALKSFNQLEKDGVQKSKPLHYAQMQAYMLGTKIDRALYVAVCKDDDRLYTERVHFDRPFAERIISRATSITLRDRIPDRLTHDPSWFVCKFCPAQKMCHYGDWTKEVNCRTCAHATPVDDGTWHCARWDSEIPSDAQLSGCASHALHPDLVPWAMADSEDDWTAVYVIDGKPVKNGEAKRGVFASSELIADHKACANADDFIEEVRESMGGRISNEIVWIPDAGNGPVV